MSSQKLTNEQIKKITQHISSLDQKQKKSVQDELNKLKSKSGGVLYKSSVDKKLGELRKSSGISEIDRRNIKNSLYGNKP
jgi:hypothetical protein